MAAITKFQDFSESLIKGRHHFGPTGTPNTFKMAFFSSANIPSVAASSINSLTPISYTNFVGNVPPTVEIVASEVSGVTTLTGTNITIIATGGAISTFRYFALYNFDTGDLICFWDHGQDVTLLTGESFTIKFNGSETSGTILTIS